MKLLKKLLIRIIVLIIIVCAVIGGMSIYKSYTSTNDLMMQKLDDQLVLRTKLVEEKIESTKRLVGTLATSPNIQIALGNGRANTDVEKQLTELLEDNSDLMTLVSLVNKDDVVFVSDRINDLKDVNISERDYLQEAKATKQLTISEVITSKADNSQVIALCQPVYSNEKYVGSIVSTIKFTLVTDLVSDTKIAENGYAYIVDIKGDDAGTLVYHKNQSLVDDKFNLYKDNNDDLNKFLDQMQTKPSGYGEYVKEGDLRIVKYQKFDNWALVLTVDEKDIEKTSIDIIKITLLAIVGAILIATVSGYLIINFSIVKPIRKLQSSMAKAGNGDLTEPVFIKTKDEIEELAHSYNQMLENQKETLMSISKISQTMTSSAEELTASSEEVNASSEEVSQNIDEMMQNIVAEEQMMKSVEVEMNKLNDSVDVSSALTIQSQEVCVSALIVAEEGRTGVQSSVASMSDISTSTTEVIESFDELNIQAKKVTGISETIKGIAEQINLLALNASIEAARAGEAGRGFTVVAEEVRKLAEQTTQESANVHKVLSEITALINKANQNVNTTKVHVDEGEDTIRSLDGKFMNIIATFDTLNKFVADLEKISKDQVIISEDIMASIETSATHSVQNSTMAQEISASAEEQAAITESLSSAAEESAETAMSLNELIQKFKL
ncbi:MAG: methyl-accepting chemotaxis protein [Clostridiales bacterium]|nr:methyl-accepting chemotaxis protein [Clostridiales bacterium]